ncbi:SDR family oxidoreductase [Altererythrobacter ishigakiensis]|jgi:NAD(P)-dependent dehydrogenase (short-subunit alcohol dehydrogenase family)|uniref:NAD(P)-dependent dehydrogenase (Short-subunit alcohol dehydrogenase family) n=1 Tax=Altererythrobacter ishigakiensis TaxID=476157 RepID=A0A562UTT5_9SPHN|nr:SDR family oxidoreductase [Altererythrobacter ishigakiensis]TWJ09035.1 NAD(P)-dependent dehydrogenase (short-subunit alcohol dehydrogenase family) [Altererythrobacter ishigakiensis]
MDIQSLFGLDGRIALVTGGSRGIGKMFVEGLLAAGCSRVYISARKVEQMQETIDEFGADKVIGIPADLSQMDGMQQLADAISAKEDKLDILINNAGAAWGQDYLEFSEAGWHRTMDLNVKTPFFLTQKLHNLLVTAASEGRPAKVINVSSIDGFRINPWETYAYQASKAGVVQLTRRVAARLIKDNIVVSSIAPGAFPSEMNKAAKNAPDASAAGIPAKRIGTAEDMAAAAIYLCSRAGDYVVGETVIVDGGVVNAWLPSYFNDPAG